ncbi:MAG TPA: radical SAM protein, partial [Clostridia bacterium]
MILVTMDGNRHVYPVSDILHPFFGPVRDLGDGLLQAGEGSCAARVSSRTSAVESGRVLVQTRLSAHADPDVPEGSAMCDMEREWSEAVPGSDVKREVKRQLYGILSEWTGIRFPWGSLTGIRPTLIARESLVLSGGGLAAAALRMETMYGVDPGKASLAVETAKREDAVQQTVSPESVCIYIGIPFCPSRCSYCSFTLPECAVRMDLAESYVDALVHEAKDVFAAIHAPVACVYFGGGTPTSLAAPVFERMIAGVLDALPLQPGCEITVEAGRPDTLTAEKLLAMRNHGVGRICVNPQTMHDVTLRRIGRRHTAGQVAESVDLVRNAGIPVLNMDLIAGLPGESTEDFAHSLRTVLAWNPENVTVHALSMKKKSRLTDHMRREGRESAGVGQLRLPDAGVAAMMD